MRWMSGLRDLSLLEASLAQPRQSFAGVDPYPGLTAKAAALDFSLIQNHPFVDGCPATMKLAGRRQARWPVG
jgi:death-on-curing protein